jgi:hypothetical protein
MVHGETVVQELGEIPSGHKAVKARPEEVDRRREDAQPEEPTNQALHKAHELLHPSFAFNAWSTVR